jgi:DNA end-binding protein Ku
MQAIWRGAISFGLISIPVRVFSATEEKSLRFNLLHADCGGRMKYNRTCALCGAENLGTDDFERGYEYEKGTYVTFTDEELAAVPLESMRTIEVLNFVPTEQIDPIYYNRSYYLGPDELGHKAYALLRKSLVDAQKVALAKVALRDKERLATLRVRGEAIVMETMYWPDEIREPAFPSAGDEDLKDRELQVAQTLIDTLTEDFDPTAFKDAYREALLELVDQKIAGKVIVAPKTEAEPAQVVDLMEALQASLEQVKSRQKKAG